MFTDWSLTVTWFGWEEPASEIGMVNLNSPGLPCMPAGSSAAFVEEEYIFCRNEQYLKEAKRSYIC